MWVRVRTWEPNPRTTKASCAKGWLPGQDSLVDNPPLSLTVPFSPQTPHRNLARLDVSGLPIPDLGA